MKAIRLILKNGKLDRLADGKIRRQRKQLVQRKLRKRCWLTYTWAKTVEVLKAAEKLTGEVELIKTTSVVGEESGEEKAGRLQWLLKQLFREVLQENNEAMCREVRESILKEMDYQFRMQEEREDEREAAQIKGTRAFPPGGRALTEREGLLWNKDDRKAERKKAEQNKMESVEERQKKEGKETEKKQEGKKNATKESAKEKPKLLQL